MRDITGVRLASMDRAAEAMCALVGNDGLHRGGFAHDTARRADMILLQVANQSAHADAADLLVVAQRIVQRRIEAIVVQRGDEFRRFRQGDADESLHVRGTAGIQFAVVLDGVKRVRVPILAIHRHHVGVSGKNQTRLLGVAQSGE